MSFSIIVPDRDRIPVDRNLRDHERVVIANSRGPRRGGCGESTAARIANVSNISATASLSKRNRCESSVKIKERTRIPLTDSRRRNL